MRSRFLAGAKDHEMRGLPQYLLILIAISLSSPAEARQPDDQDGQPAAEDTAGEPSAGGEEGSSDTAPAEVQVEAAAAPQQDLEALRTEYFKLRDRLFQSRARASAVASALYSTRLAIHLDYGSGRYYSIPRSTIRLDGANIFDDSEGAITSDKAPRFEGYIAPGRHQISIRIEAVGKDDQRFTSVIDNSFIVQATQGKDLVVKVNAKDDGDIAYKWKKKQQGSYHLHLDVSVKSKTRKDDKSKHLKRTGELRKHAPAKSRRS